MGYDGDTERMVAANRANWDERVPIHVGSAFYGGRPGEGWFADYEWADLGDLAGTDLVHLQCHLGGETLALARRGARAVGLDFSGASVRAARRLAADAGVAVEFVEADVHDAPAALGGRRFDTVYTGKGALCYVPDLDRWAAVVADLLRPGGVLYVVEFHPLLYSFGVLPGPDDSGDLVLRGDFLGGGGVQERVGTYTDGPGLTEHPVSYEWRHDLGAVVTALAGAGLRVERLRESEWLPWPRWPSMVTDGQGWFRLPDGQPRVPLFYALLATRG